jgi:alkylation response protein AidB-like acyl-CoA dehydrogenase
VDFEPTDDQATLPRIVDGSLHVCFGVTEPGAWLDYLGSPVLGLPRSY